MTADEAYGDNGPLRAFLEQRQVPYVLAISCDHMVTTAAGRHRAGHLARALPTGPWQRCCCDAGAKGQRRYDWALVAATSPVITILIQRSLTGPASWPSTSATLPARPRCPS